MCDTAVVVGTEGVLFAKNSDRDVNEAQFLDWRPREEHAAGVPLHCTWIEIPQVRETHAVLLSRPYWIWGAEIGANEHGVAIGNEAVFTRAPYAETGLTGMDLLRLGLERGATAREAVDVIVGLLEEHGQGGGCGHENRDFTYHNSFIVADPRQAFVLETAGRDSAVEPVEGARTISNALTIPEFARQHGERLRSRASRARSRHRRTAELALRATGPADMMSLLRDHGRGQRWPRYSWLSGAMSAPCVHAGGLLVVSQTTGSWVSELAPGSVRHWATGTAAPCLSLFKPVSVDQPVDTGPRPGERADAESLWWRHEALHRRVQRDPARLADVLLPERDAFEERWRTYAPPSDVAFKEADGLLERWTRRVSERAAADRRPVWVRRIWNQRNARAGLDPCAPLAG
ncbi:MAG: C69 family dipeptidase [Deltaproteobacteria bacterium]|nr:C69 family dipeptidase [Deltaproteobacteria bacterium]